MFGGCPVLSQFDVLETTGTGIYTLAYPDHGGNPYYAGVLASRTNSQAHDVYNAWFGFSIMRIRNAQNGVMARTEFYNRITRSWMIVGGGSAVDYTDDEIPAATMLGGVYPNPFNPATRVSFSLKKKGHVSLRVYDVTGRLVRVLVDETREAGTYSTVWKGNTDRGYAAASGVYFCDASFGKFRQSTKMLLLK